MGKKRLAILLLYTLGGLSAQEVQLPPDFRQHNVLMATPGLFSPTFNMDLYGRHTLGLWSRWQWQTPDGDPTSLFLNYTLRKTNAAIGAGFFQHNTRRNQQTGGIANFAYTISFSESISLALGTNVFAYSKELNDNNLFPDEPILPFTDDTRDFILQLAPAVELRIADFGAGASFENLFDYSFQFRGALTEGNEKMVTTFMHYTFGGRGLNPADGLRVRPLVYLKQIPGFDTQVGLNATLMAPKFWVQGGYNSFYGPSAGVGGRFMKRLAVGGVVEFASDNAPDSDGTTYELLASYSFGDLDGRKKVVDFDPEEDAGAEKALEAARQEAEADARRDSLAAAETARRTALQRQRDSVQLAETRAARLRDSLEAENMRALALQRQKDSLEQVRREIAAREEVKPEAGERYQEAASEGDQEPGFYLIANVFGTERYFNAFMQELRSKGLEPKSLYRKENKYNYVYLERYDSMDAARRARDSKFGGRYSGDLWIMRIR